MFLIETIIMATHKILAEETVAVSEVRKNPGRYFTDKAVAVMSHNKATGYMVGAELFENMIMILEQNQAGKAIAGQFRPSAARLQEIAAASADFLRNASEEDLGQFSE